MKFRLKTRTARGSGFALRSSAAVIVAALAAAAMPAKADPVVYVAGTGNEFGTLDLTTGAFTNIGTLALPALDQIFGMGFGSNGTLYALDSSIPANLYSIDTSDADVTLVGGVDQSTIDATSDAAGELFALSQDNPSVLYTLDPASTGRTTHTVGSTVMFPTGLAAVTADGSTLYAGAIDPMSATTDLYSINTTTGVSTLIGDTGGQIINGLFVAGTLYGFDDSTGAIDTINTTTGVATQIATADLPNGDVVLASAEAPLVSSAPEPTSLILLCAGLAVIALKRGRAGSAATID